MRFPFFKRKEKTQPARDKKIALVLGGGGARGFAHIGAMKAFEEDGFDLEAYKSEASRLAAFWVYERGVRRRVSLYKFLIMVVAFALMFLLYNSINDLIVQYNAIRYGAEAFIFTAT